MENQNAVNVFNRLADLYQEKFMDTGMYHDSFNLFCNSIATPNAQILELACGPGNITRYLLDKRPDFTILGTDLAPNMLKLARINNPEAQFELMDCRDIGSLTDKFNGIMCGFCLPYLSKPEALKLITDAKHVLHPGGILYISTMEKDNALSDYQMSSRGDSVFMNYHEAGYLTDALTDNGFRIIDVQRIEYPGKDGDVVTDLIIVAGL